MRELRLGGYKAQLRFLARVTRTDFERLFDPILRLYDKDLMASL
jgi:hypothetical protein